MDAGLDTSALVIPRLSSADVLAGRSRQGGSAQCGRDRVSQASPAVFMSVDRGNR